MSVTIACPSCQHSFSVHPAELGRPAKCPSCRGEFEARPADGSPMPTRSSSASTGYQAGAPPVPARGGYESSRGMGGYGPGISVEQTGGSWGATVVGLRLVQVIVVSFLVLSGVLLAMKFVDPNVFAPRNPTALPALALALACVVLLMGLVAFVGLCMCCSAPYPPARNRAIASVLLIVGVVVVGIGGGLVLGVSVAAMGPRGGRGDALAAIGIGSLVIGGLVLVLAVLFAIFWILFHAAVADCFQSPRLRTLAITTLVAALVLSVLSWAIQIGSIWFIASMRPTPGVIIAAELASFACSVIIYVLYLTLCSRTIRVIRDGTGG